MNDDKLVSNELKVPFRDYITDIRVVLLLIALCSLFVIDDVPVENLFSYLTWKYIHILSTAMFAGLVIIMSLTACWLFFDIPSQKKMLLVYKPVF